jgi:hypothetical protein
MFWLSGDCKNEDETYTVEVMQLQVNQNPEYTAVIL